MMHYGKEAAVIAVAAGRDISCVVAASAKDGNENLGEVPKFLSALLSRIIERDFFLFKKQLCPQSLDVKILVFAV
jgi:hypothetical protein